MSFPRYHEYSSADIPWLREVPAHWTTGPLRPFVLSIESGTSVNAVDEPSSNGSAAVLKTSCVYTGRFDPSQNKAIVSEEVGLASCPVKAGRLIVSRMNTPDLVGAAGVTRVAYPHLFLPDRLWQLLLRNIQVEFVHYWMQTSHYRAQVQAACTGTSASMKNLTQDQFRRFELPVPPPVEQALIVKLLDRETAKIDALVAEQERLIEMLKEKRRAVIVEAVTKGLDAAVSMKAAAPRLAWLKKIPAHWRPMRLKHLSPDITVGIVVNPTSFVSDSGVPFIYGGDIREGVIDWRSSRRIAPDISAAQAKTILRTADLLTVRVGAPGVTAVVPPECDGGNCASVMLVRRGSFNSQWLCYVMNSRVVRFQVEQVQYGAAQEQFNISHAVDFWVPTPPRAEQDEIAAYLDEQTKVIDALEAEVMALVQRLHERRAALISAAVTGQIDVRGLVTQEVA